MKNILFIVPKLKLGGAERQTFELAKIGKKMNYKIKILEIEENKESNFIEDIECLKINFFDTKSSKILKKIKKIRMILKLREYISNSEYDYIFFTNINFIWLSLFKSKAKKIFSVREYNLEYFKGFKKILLKRMDILTTNNYPSYIKLKEIKKKSYLFYNIINIGKKIQEIEKNKKEYLIVSNLNKHKNIEPVINVFKELSKENYKLKIVGKIEDENYFKKLFEDKIKNISYLGYLNEEKLEEEYLKSEGIIHFSKQEGTANSILDAIKYKKPVIVLDITENLAIMQEVEDYIVKNENELKEKIRNISNGRIDIKKNNEYLYEKLLRLFSEKNGLKFYKMLETEE